jgi:hypothetical protein
VIRDLCPIHGIPMWWWPTGGEWACQRPECGVKTPVGPTETEPFRRFHAAYRDALLTTPPRAFPFLVTGV